MRRLPEIQAMILQFPWGRHEPDGSFRVDVARARFGVLGIADMGFWSVRSVMQAIYGRFEYTDGTELLRGTHLDDVDGWKLDKAFIPFRDFSQPDAARPKLLTEVLRSWKDWHDWRRLPMASPASLLMNYPLTVYWLLVDTLGVAGPGAGNVNKRVPLHVHVIGIEVELNYLPLFSELALLLPYHDIKLVLFGERVHNIVAEGKKTANSIAGKASPETPVFTYEAPSECGGSQLQIFLHGADRTWAGHTEIPTYGKPHALIALNGGLTVYPEWYNVIRFAHFYGMPFGSTDYMEQSAEHTVELIPQIISPLPPRKRYTTGLNPFARPGQRLNSRIRLPNLINGFTIAVVKTNE
ncbi:hypothetical protein CYLTODRAFT_392734 [Cylindrobasidium torrendii FP15055 ss-10]|uniref:Mitochondrial splicing suppressor 51-like C-terminal domain-containing protein n=1 Tax=Cylindrobasidium torrendii FP15055 ss-10 TaxID=1314674 RepID=A0A0D7BIC7_9AGAR|nr:hypothetical protein CYLTODRAFT_392734 [Cylindrobasidium torrendii FP15055 ss-10]